MIPPPAAAARYAEGTADAVLAALETRREGLTDGEAARRRVVVGSNEVATERPPTWYGQLARAFTNPFNLLLAALAVVSGLTGDFAAMTFIGVMVVLSTGLRFIQEFRSQRAALALRALVHTRATVERQGDSAAEQGPSAARRDIPLAELVPGDIVYLSAGDMIPADVRLLTAKELFISQGALTGESVPVEKFDHPAGAAASAVATDLVSICYMGTSVVSGSASAVVFATGPRTVFGHLAAGVSGRRGETAFDVGVRRVSWLFIRFIAVMVPVVLLVNSLTKGNWMEALLFGLAIAVGLTPEMLPVIVTTNLARGAVRMSRRRTIVKRLASIQDIGAMDVLCTDKTGTLTQDKVVLVRHVNVAGEEDDRVLELTYLNSYYQTGLKNLLDVAVLAHGDLHQQLAVDHAYTKVDEIPFDFTRRRMSVVVAHQQPPHEAPAHRLICKGAADEMLACATQLRVAPTEEAASVIPLDDARRAEAQALVDTMNGQGFRVVAVAERDYPPTHGTYGVADEQGLTLAGFVAFLDPPKESAGPALAALAAHAVQVKILTGDNERVTRTVCAQVGLIPERIVLGPELAALDEAALAAVASKERIFAKLTPDDKVRIVRALRTAGHTVGFLGDGINDAGALREADVGISVDSAVDIAKESADIILLEKNLRILDAGIIEGRRTFGNTMKYLKMTASSNFGNVFSVLVASALFPFLPMLPVQLLANNLLYDISQTSIPWDDMDEEYLEQPRTWRADDLMRFMLTIGPISSLFDLATFAVLWWGFGAVSEGQAGLFRSGWFVESLLTQTLIVHLIRTTKIPFVESRAAWPVLLLTSAVMLFGLVLPWLPFGRLLGFQPLPLRFLGWLLFVLVAYPLALQCVKRWYLRRYDRWL